MIVNGGLIFFGIVAFVVIVAILKTAVIVPQKAAFIVERETEARTFATCAAYLRRGATQSEIRAALGN